MSRNVIKTLFLGPHQRFLRSLDDSRRAWPHTKAKDHAGLYGGGVVQSLPWVGKRLRPTFRVALSYSA